MSGGLKGPLSPPQELEVGGRRPPYLLVLHIPLCVVSVWQVLLVWWQNMELTFCSKNAKKLLFKPPYWGTSKNQWLDLKVCADPSWHLVLKNGLRKHSSLINDWVIDVWSWCKKREGEGKVMNTSSGLGLLCQNITLFGTLKKCGDMLQKCVQKHLGLLNVLTFW